MLKSHREVLCLFNNPEGQFLVVPTQPETLVNFSRLALKSRELHLKLGGTLPPEDKFHSEGTLMLGGNLKSESTINRMNNLCPWHPTHGAFLFKATHMPPQDRLCLPHLIRGMSLSKEIHTSRQDKICRLRNNLLMDKCPTQPSTLKTHPVILRSHKLLTTFQILCTLAKTNPT
jgi:hypothetical protein